MTDDQIAATPHEVETMQHRDHALIQQLEKDCTGLREENARLRNSMSEQVEPQKYTSGYLAEVPKSPLALSENQLWGENQVPDGCSQPRSEGVNNVNLPMLSSLQGQSDGHLVGRG
jgi:hypothetical protein